MKKYILFPKSGYVYYLEVEPIPTRPDWFVLPAEKRIVTMGTDAFDDADAAWRTLYAAQEAVVREAQQEHARIHRRWHTGKVQDPDA